MSRTQQLVPADCDAESTAQGVELLRLLVNTRSAAAAPPSVPLPCVVLGELLAITDDGATPLVVVTGVEQDVRALRARTVVELHSAHIGHQLVLAFERGDPDRPIVMGVLAPSNISVEQQEASRALAVESDGQRMIVSAKEQLVLRCGKASITLTRAGKLLLEGSYVLSRSSGVNRVKGGSVQLN